MKVANVSNASCHVPYTHVQILSEMTTYLTLSFKASSIFNKVQ